MHVVSVQSSASAASRHEDHLGGPRLPEEFRRGQRSGACDKGCDSFIACGPVSEVPAAATQAHEHLVRQSSDVYDFDAHAVPDYTIGSAGMMPCEG